MNFSSSSVELFQRPCVNISSLGGELYQDPNVNISSSGGELFQDPNVNFASPGVELFQDPDFNFFSPVGELFQDPHINFSSSGNEFFQDPNMDFYSSGSELFQHPNFNISSSGGGLFQDPNANFSSLGGDMFPYSNVDISSSGGDAGDGSSIFFCDDDWCGDRPLNFQFPRVYAFDEAKSCIITERLRLLDWFSVFRRPPRGDVDYVATGWNRLVPSKVNVFFWRLNLNRIHTTVNIDKRGIDIGSVLCLVCDSYVETSNHLFFSCEMAMDLWVLVARWWELHIPVTSSVLEWVVWIDSARLPSKVTICLDGVAITLMWSIWCFRNKLLFSFTKHVKAVLCDFIQSQSFLWINARNPKFRLIGCRILD
ncbi:RNA-directed DNA polymerase, eukaryota, reverse transcriptase zinc-binding domain protein [Tanacetum coccineum]